MKDFGMTLRDYFAAKAMQSLISKIPLLDKNGEFSEKYSNEDIILVRKGISESAYNYADEMILIRDEGVK